MEFPFEPMHPLLREHVPTDSEFLHQVKWDGVRILAARRHGRVLLYNRNGRLRSSVYPELVTALQQLPGGDFILDGEAISLDSTGRPNLHQLLHRDLSTRQRLNIPVLYMVFDCLECASTGESLITHPLDERLDALSQLIPKTQGNTVSSLLRSCESFDDGKHLLSRMADLHMEGIVSKRRTSPYRPGQRTTEWQKIKLWHEETFAVTGVIPREERMTLVLASSLEDDMPIGNVLCPVEFPLHAWLANQPVNAKPTGGAIAVRPGLSVLVRFLEWTEAGSLRHPTVIAMLPDSSLLR